MSTQTTRRDLLRFGTTAAAYAAGASIVTGGIAIASQAKGAALSPGLAALIDDHRRATERFEHTTRAVINPAFEKRAEAKKEHQRRVDAIPHAEETGGTSWGGKPITLTSRNSGNRRTAEVYLELDAADPNRGTDWNDMIEGARRFIKADDARQEAVGAIGEPPTFDDLHTLEQEALAPVHAARRAVIYFPCAALVDLRTKLAWIESDEGMDGEDLLPLVMADVERIVAQEGR